MAWYRPQQLAEALELLDAKRPKVVCGGTDLFVNWLSRRAESTVTEWLDIQNISELKQIVKTDEGLQIGSAVTAAEIWGNSLFAQLPALQQAARVIGGWQIQNRASIGGNIANASPAADMVVPLVSYGAVVNLSSARGKRSVPVIDLITGPKATQIAEDELITSVLVPSGVLGVPQQFLRHDQRGGTDISLVSVSVLLKGNAQHLDWIQIAVGAANYKPVILSDLSGVLHAGLPAMEAVERIADLYAGSCNPVTDVRASAEYRRAMVKVFIKRAAAQLLGVGQEGSGV